MFNITTTLIDNFVLELHNAYKQNFGSLKPEYCEIIEWVARSCLELIANSDALYHNIEHTILVTLVGQEILRGQQIKYGNVTTNDWVNFIIALICHDIGYIKGVCKDDNIKDNLYCIDYIGTTIKLDNIQTDASLTPYHVTRGKIFVRDRFIEHDVIEFYKVQKMIELTRFPVPDDDDHKNTNDYPGLIRAADLIGQLGDIRYSQKIAALFYEFNETGTAEKLCYNNPTDLKINYPKHFWKNVYPYIKDAITLLNLTQNGKMYVATLYSNVFTIEHEL
jgi:hypothetical protein